MPGSHHWNCLCETISTSSAVLLLVGRKFCIPLIPADNCAGGLIVMGLFLMHWSITECIERFIALAHKTFARSTQSRSAIGRLQSLALSYWRDWQYSSFPIEQAFQSSFGDDVRMFNPLLEDTKVAVTTTATKEPQPCIMTNYNGGIRSGSVGM